MLHLDRYNIYSQEAALIITSWMCLSVEEGAALDIAKSGILPSLAQALRSKSCLSCQVALVVAEMAREGEILLKFLSLHAAVTNWMYWETMWNTVTIQRLDPKSSYAETGKSSLYGE